ncbi:MAG: T9SS type A sorting domain-containing protein [Bacteroidota bacterium]
MKRITAFLMGAMLLLASSLSAQMLDEFTWNNVHGHDYIQKEQDQLLQGPCHVFASVAAMEAGYELYYNYWGANLDLSERFVFSRCFGNDPATTGIENSLDSLKKYRVVLEECAPYGDSCNNNSCFGGEFHQNNENCDCPTCPETEEEPEESYKLVDYSTLDINNMATQDDLKAAIIRDGPVALWCLSDSLYVNTNHAFLLIGWRTNSAGLIEWHMRDSWPGGAITKYYLINLVTLFNNNASFEAFQLGRIDKYTNESEEACGWEKFDTPITCQDNDGDGYYFWGLGPKPDECPCSAPNAPDVDDSDYNITYLDGTDVVLNTCTVPTVSTYQYENFESEGTGTGGCYGGYSLASNVWENVSGDWVDWQPRSGPTPSSGTGPSGGAPGGWGKYVYLEASGCSNKNAYLQTKNRIDLGCAVSPRITYWYHQYGSNQGNHKVQVSTNCGATWTNLGSTISGNQGNYWKMRTLYLNSFVGQKIMIRFEGKTGFGYLSDIALDYINISFTTTSKEGEQQGPQNLSTFLEEVKIYPNPARDKVVISFAQEIPAQVRILTPFGREVLRGNMIGTQAFNVSNLSAGMYLVEIVLGEEGDQIHRFSRKLIIE